jgi:cysteinyl-tRNA synthetase
MAHDYVLPIVLFHFHDVEIVNLNHPHVYQYWMHNGFINIDNEKMSKSLGNFILVHDIIKEVDPDEPLCIQ